MSSKVTDTRKRKYNSTKTTYIPVKYVQKRRSPAWNKMRSRSSGLSKKYQAFRHRSHGMLNPFTLVRDLKIPDGACQFSHGRQFRVNAVINIPANTQIEGLLYPGFTSGCVINGADGSLNNSLAHMFWHPSFTDLNVTPVASTNCLFQQVPLEVARWRGVSYGLRMTLLNTDQQNDGWFETSLGTKALNDAHMVCATAGAASPSINAMTTSPMGPLTNVHVGLNPDNFVRTTPASDPGFKAGALKSLQNYVFTLPRLNNDSNFIACGEQASAQFGTLTTPTRLFACANTATGAPSELRQRNFDDQLACRYFTITAGSSGSNILFEYVANIELVYDETSAFNDFQTVNKKTAGINNLLADQAKQIHVKHEPMDLTRRR